MAVLVMGCYSPTLPLPPPSDPSETNGGAPNLVKLHGAANSAEPSAIILIINTDTTFNDQQRATATIVNTDGSWDALVFAVKNDVLNISQQVGNDDSPSISFTVLIN